VEVQTRTPFKRISEPEPAVEEINAGDNLSELK
jgi:hypothetical protein